MKKNFSHSIIRTNLDPNQLVEVSLPEYSYVRGQLKKGFTAAVCDLESRQEFTLCFANKNGDFHFDLYDTKTAQEAQEWYYA